MSTLVRALHAARRRVHTRGDDGYALVIVLGVIMFTSVLIIALLGLALTTAKIANQQAQASRETRSADGAVESAVATIAHSSGGGNCPGLPQTTSITSTSHLTMGPSNEDDVTLQCSNATVSADPTQPLGGNDVKIVGGATDALKYTGTAPLTFTSDITVRGGADVTGNGPAVDAQGQYVQGSGPADCGTLGQSGTHFVQDRDRKPVCGDATAAALTVGTQQLVDPTDTIASPPQTVPLACSPVVQLSPGTYDAYQTSQLNKLMSSCAGSTFWFQPPAVPGQPGVYSFDANPNRFGGAALVVDDPTIKVVFGQQAGTTGECDPAVAGASIQLSGRMSLQHRAGRMTVCPGWNGTTPLPAIVQVPQAATDPITLAASSSDFKLNTTNGDGGPALLARPDDASTFAKATFCAGCMTTTRKYLAATFVNVPPDPLTSAKVVLATKETPPTPPPGLRRFATITLTLPGGGTCTTAQTDAGRTNWQLSAYELVTDPNCGPLLQGKPGSVLEGASVSVEYKLACTAPFGDLLTCAAGEASTISVRGIRLVVNAKVAQTASATGSGAAVGTWTTADQAARDDATFAQATQRRCVAGSSTVPNCVWQVPGQTFALTVNGFQVPPGMAGTPQTLRVLFKNAPNGTTLDWASDPGDGTRTDLIVTLASGATCTVSSGGYSHSATESQFDLLGAGTCKGVIKNLADLNGSSVKIQLTTGCAVPKVTDLTKPTECVSVQLPQFQYVSLVATSSDVQTDPPSSLVTVSAAAGTDFHAFGTTVLPNTALQVRWAGGVDATSRPLFFGSLVVKSLSSTMAAGASMGVVCCQPPPSDLTRIEASVGGRVRAVAVVSIGAAGSGPGGTRTVDVQDWQLCITGSCDTTPAAPTAPGP